MVETLVVLDLRIFLSCALECYFQQIINLTYVGYEASLLIIVHHEVSVKYAGQHVPESPAKIGVLPQFESQKVKATGAGIDKRVKINFKVPFFMLFRASLLQFRSSSPLTPQMLVKVT